MVEWLTAPVKAVKVMINTQSGSDAGDKADKQFVKHENNLLLLLHASQSVAQVLPYFL